jgi:hypothetical protein
LKNARAGEGDEEDGGDWEMVMQCRGGDGQEWLFIYNKII